MKLTHRQKAYGLIGLGVVGLFLPVIPGVVLMVLGFALLADTKRKLDIDLSKLARKVKRDTE